MEMDYHINEDAESQPFPSIRGEREVEVPIISYVVEQTDEEKEVVGLTDKSCFADLITKFGLQEFHDEFPQSWGPIHQSAKDSPGPYVYLYEYAPGEYTGVRYDAFQAAIQILYDGSKSFYSSDLTLYAPTRGVDGSDRPGTGPWVIECDRTPEDWLVQKELGGQETFDELVERADGDREFVLSEAGDNHDGVLAVLAPSFPEKKYVKKLESDDSPSVAEAIEEYKEETGDQYLDDEDALDSFLKARGVY